MGGVSYQGEQARLLHGHHGVAEHRGPSQEFEAEDPHHRRAELRPRPRVSDERVLRPQHPGLPAAHGGHGGAPGRRLGRGGGADEGRSLAGARAGLDDPAPGGEEEQDGHHQPHDPERGVRAVPRGRLGRPVQRPPRRLAGRRVGDCQRLRPEVPEGVQGAHRRHSGQGAGQLHDVEARHDAGPLHGGGGSRHQAEAGQEDHRQEAAGTKVEHVREVGGWPRRLGPLPRARQPSQRHRGHVREEALCRRRQADRPGHGGEHQGRVQGDPRGGRVDGRGDQGEGQEEGGRHVLPHRLPRRAAGRPRAGQFLRRPDPRPGRVHEERPGHPEVCLEVRPRPVQEAGGQVQLDDARRGRGRQRILQPRGERHDISGWHIFR